MNFHLLSEAPPPELGAALEHFEKQFSYSLGRDTTFRISHGRSYVSFFTAMGDMTLIVAERDGQVLGTLAGIRRPLRKASGEFHIATYLCDLKVAPHNRSGRVLLGLARQLVSCWREAGGWGGYSVVMDGTADTPNNYTGRCGIPQFEKVGQITVLRVAVPESSHLPLLAKQTSLVEVERLLQRLTVGEHLPCGGIPTLRSIMPPVVLLDSNNQACGVVEDTRLGKRLFTDSGEEMVSTHLSHFAYADAASGARLLHDALTITKQAGYSAMFTALPSSRANALISHLTKLTVKVATASIYAHGISGTENWHIDTSEI